MVGVKIVPPPPHFSHTPIYPSIAVICYSLLPSLAQNLLPRSVDSWLKAEEKGVGNKKEQTKISVSPLLPPITETCRANTRAWLYHTYLSAHVRVTQCQAFWLARMGSHSTTMNAEQNRGVLAYSLIVCPCGVRMSLFPRLAIVKFQHSPHLSRVPV